MSYGIRPFERRPEAHAGTAIPKERAMLRSPTAWNASTAWRIRHSPVTGSTVPDHQSTVLSIVYTFFNGCLGRRFGSLTIRS